MMNLAGVLLATLGFANDANDLDKPYFGLEFTDSRGSVVISNVDLDHRTARKLEPNVVILSVNDVKIETAENLRAWLDQREDRESVHFEVLGADDSKAEKVPVRAESLRTLLPRRFRKERDRDTKQTLHVPKLLPSQVHVAVAEGFDGKSIGIRLRFYPKDSLAVAGRDLRFSTEAYTAVSSRSPRIATRPEEFHYSGLTKEDERKIPTLSRNEMLKLQREAYIELQVDRTDELLKLLDFGSAARAQIGYGQSGLMSFNARTLTANELRNVKYCLLLYHMLAESIAPKEEGDQPAHAAAPSDAANGLSASAKRKADIGWKLWQDRKYAGKTPDGFYTDPDPTTQVKDFWSDGEFARVDDTNDGMFETIFKVKDKELLYIGMLERPFIFKHIVKGHEQTVEEYLNSLRTRR